MNPYVKERTTSQLNPTFGGDRLQVFDILRGVGLFGILIANVNYFSGQFLNPNAAKGTILDRGTVFLLHVFVEGKFYSLFSLAFGMGLAILKRRCEAKGVAFSSFCVRRLVLLLAIGLAHACLLWAGDILTVYALVGLLVLLFHRSSDRGVILWALAMMVLPLIAYAGMWYAQLPNPDPFAKSNGPLDFVLSSYATGEYRDVLRANSIHLQRRWLGLLVTVRFPAVLAMFLLGYYAERKRIVSCFGEHKEFLSWWSIAGVVIIGVVANVAMAWLMETVPYLPASMLGFVQKALYTFGVPVLAVAYVLSLLLILRLDAGKRWLGLLAPAGQMALTNYLLQSVICLLVFYGFGMGLFGKVRPLAASGVAVLVFCTQLIASYWWLRIFRYGPIEWGWRCATYGSFFPLRRSKDI